MAHREKLSHAYTHLRILDALLREWVDSEPYELIRERHGHEEVTHAKVRTPVPEQAALVIGDAIYNMRSSLDHLAYSLAVANVSASRLKNDKVMFPIHAAIGSYMDAGVRAVSQMSQTAQDRIEKLQPYHGVNGPDRHPLGRLNKLSNIDKHRDLAFTGTVKSESTLTVNPKTRDANVNVSGGYRLGPLGDHAEIARLRWVVTGPNPYVEVDAEFKLDVAFPQPGPAAGEVVMTVLGEIFEHISDQVFPPLEEILHES